MNPKQPSEAMVLKPGDTDIRGDFYYAGIHVGEHFNRIECYGREPVDAERLRDRVLTALAATPPPPDEARALLVTRLRDRARQMESTSRRQVGDISLLCLAADTLAASLPVAGEVERANIVAWLREQSDKGADIGIEKEKGTTARAAYGGGSFALHRAADEIEQGGHLEAATEIACEACCRPVLRGQLVHCYEDSEVHVDCENPFAVTDDPEAVVMVGNPLKRAALAPAAKEPGR